MRTADCAGSAPGQIYVMIDGEYVGGGRAAADGRFSVAFDSSVLSRGDREEVLLELRYEEFGCIGSAKVSVPEPKVALSVDIDVRSVTEWLRWGSMSQDEYLLARATLDSFRMKLWREREHLLSNPDPMIRATMVRVSHDWRFDYPPIVDWPVLVERIEEISKHDEHWLPRYEAGLFFHRGNDESPAGIASIVRDMRATDPQLRIFALSAFKVAKAPIDVKLSHLDEVAARLEAELARERAEAAAVIARMGRPAAAALPLLRRAAEDEEESVRREARHAIARLEHSGEEDEDEEEEEAEATVVVINQEDPFSFIVPGRAASLLARHDISGYGQCSTGLCWVSVPVVDRERAIAILGEDAICKPYLAYDEEMVESEEYRVLRVKSSSIALAAHRLLAEQGVTSAVESEDGRVAVWVPAAMRARALELLRADPALEPFAAKSLYGRDRER